MVHLPINQAVKKWSTPHTIGNPTLLSLWSSTSIGWQRFLNGGLLGYFYISANDDSLRQQLLDFDQHIVHVAEHSELQGLYFQNEDGNAQLINQAALKSLFAKISCIFVNACNNED